VLMRRSKNSVRCVHPLEVPRPLKRRCEALLPFMFISNNHNLKLVLLRSHPSPSSHVGYLKSRFLHSHNNNHRKLSPRFVDRKWSSCSSRFPTTTRVPAERVAMLTRPLDPTSVGLVVLARVKVEMTRGMQRMGRRRCLMLPLVFSRLFDYGNLLMRTLFLRKLFSFGCCESWRMISCTTSREFFSPLLYVLNPFYW